MDLSLTDSLCPVKRRTKLKTRMIITLGLVKCSTDRV